MVGIINFIAAAFFFMIPNEIGFKSFTAASRPSNRENHRQNKIDICTFKWNNTLWGVSQMILSDVLHRHQRVSQIMPCIRSTYIRSAYIGSTYIAATSHALLLAFTVLRRTRAIISHADWRRHRTIIATTLSDIRHQTLNLQNQVGKLWLLPW